MRVKLTIGAVLVGIIILFGLGLSFLAPEDPRIWQTYPRNQRPSAEHFLGTTALGQDTFWLLSWSIRNSLLLGVSVAATRQKAGRAANATAAPPRPPPAARP